MDDNCYSSRNKLKQQSTLNSDYNNIEAKQKTIVMKNLEVQRVNTNFNSQIIHKFS